MKKKKLFFKQFCFFFILSTSFFYPKTIMSLQLMESKISLDVYNETLKKVLNEIESKSGIHFSYNSRIPQLMSKITLEANSESLSTILNKILCPNYLSYIEINNHIVLNSEYPVNKKQQSAFANFQGLIKGKVVDEKGNPLPGALIVVKGTKVATVSDFEGNFTIDLPDSFYTLIVSCIGMNSKEVNSLKSPLIITLLESIQSLK